VQFFFFFFSDVGVANYMYEKYSFKKKISGWCVAA